MTEAVPRYAMAIIKGYLNMPEGVGLVRDPAGDYVMHAHYQTLEAQLREMLERIARLESALRRAWLYIDCGSTAEFWQQCRVCRASCVDVGPNAAPLIHKPDCWYGNALAPKEAGNG